MHSLVQKLLVDIVTCLIGDAYFYKIWFPKPLHIIGIQREIVIMVTSKMAFMFPNEQNHLFLMWQL